MTDFTPPIRDLRFLIHDVIGLQTVAELPGFRETSPDLVDAILEEAAKLAKGVRYYLARQSVKCGIQPIWRLPCAPC